MKICFKLLLLSCIGVFLFLCTLSSCKTTGLSKPQQLAQFSKMDWLQGDWLSKEVDIIFNESWVKQSDTLYTGISVFVMGGDTIYKEAIRLEPGKLHIYYNVITVNDGKTVRSSYVLLKNSGKSMMFEDRSSDDINRITYTFLGEGKLKISTEETKAKETVKESFILKKR